MMNSSIPGAGPSNGMMVKVWRMAATLTEA
jgi:hypothetical protein